MLKITNDKGRDFNVRVIQVGERYGRADCLTHGGNSWDRADPPPLVCFYDGTNVGKSANWDYGQPITSYYTVTLLDDEKSISESGLDLHGGVSDWKVDGPAMVNVFRYIRAECS